MSKIKNNNYKMSAVSLSVLLILIVLISTVLSSSACVYASSLKKVGDSKVLEAEFDPAVGGSLVEMPAVKAKAAVLYSTDLGKTIYSKNADEKLDPYSITKLVTAYLAAEKLDMDKVVTVSKEAAKNFENGTTMYLVKGEKLSVEQLIYGTLLLSGNDAAYALAEAVSGSEERFVELMNETVTEWGCENTHFENPNGMKEEGHYTTANDYCIILQHVMENEQVKRISACSSYKMPATNCSPARTMKGHMIIRDIIMINNNTKRKGIGEESGISCGKTGYWDDDDCSVSLMYEKDELSAVLVLLGDSIMGRDADAEALFHYAHDVTPGYVAAQANKELDKTWIKGGEYTKVGYMVDNEVYAYPRDGEESQIETELKTNGTLEAPIEKGDEIGEYLVYVDGKKVASETAYASESIAEGWFPSQIYISNRAAIAIGVGLVLVLIFVILVSRTKRNHMVENNEERGK